MLFTPAQEAAITAQNPELLVSAAAGSGKTAVLVQRILRMVKEGLSIDRMLIVTFTRAAAGEMRERLEQSLSAAAGDDNRLRKQADLVASAQISTIHAFCQKTVRRFFQHCQIDPQFGLCDERTRRAFWEESMEETLDWLYQSAKTDPDLLSLCQKYDERSIQEMLETLHRFLMSRPDPMEWLAKYEDKQWSAERLDAEPMAREFCREAALIIEGMLSVWKEAKALSGALAFADKYVAVVLSDGQALRGLMEACQKGMRALMEASGDVQFMRLPVFKPQTTDEAECAARFKELRERYRGMVKKLLELLPQDVEEAVGDMQRMVPATRGLGKAVRFLSAAFSQRKRDKAVIDFNDLEHMTLKVLREEPLRREVSQQFDAIFVDEYQDVSELQEAILNGLKRESGQFAFYVGDVKQSIYRFRLAEPGLFLGKLNRFSPEKEARQRRITLNRNFRSRTCVLDAVNRVFEHVMDSRVTEIDYDEDAHLVPGIPSEGDPATELHILNAENLRTQEKIMAQAEWIARDILAHQDELPFRDIAILLPVGKNISDKVELALSKAGIPVYCEGANDAMASDEITQALQYLTVLDNLMNDVALLGVLRSPLFEMTEEELAAIRLGKPEREASYLMALIHASHEAHEPLRSRCQKVVETFEHERFLLRSMPMSDYLWDFISRSGLYAHYGAQPGGKLRQANLRMLCHRAAEWEKTNTSGLNGFVETMLLDTGSSETAPTVIHPWENVVRVMTIHKSKGLEFPTVYVMNLERSLLKAGAGSKMSIHGDIGFSLGYVNEEARTRRTTLAQSAIDLRNQSAERAERSRLLYVALTRPKSRLVMVGADALSGVESQLDKRNDVYAVRQAGSMLDWIVQCLSPGELSTEEERKTANPQQFSSLSTGFPQKNAPWRAVFHIQPAIEQGKEPKTAILPIEIPPQDMDKPVEKEPMHLPMKVGVTALCRAMEEGGGIEEGEETADEKRWPWEVAKPRLLASLPKRPAFLEPPKEERALATGVMTHRVLGLMNLDPLRALQSPKAIYAAVCREVERLEQKGVLTAQEAGYVNRGMIARFLESELGKRMLHSGLVQREWSFNLRIREPFPTIVQGVIDLCFLEDGKWVLVDFKTDSVQSAEALWPRYRRQIGFYRQALEQGTPYPVGEALLFSLRLGQEAKE